MKLFTADQLRRLIANGAASNATDKDLDHRPVVKLFTPDGAATWLLTEVDEEDDTAFGLCDLGMGFPELGYASLTELKNLRGQLGLPVERDRHCTLDKPLSYYVNKAAEAGRIAL